TLIPRAQSFLERGRVDRLTEQIPGALRVVSPLTLPPVLNGLSIGPGQVLVGVHRDVRVFGIIRRPGLEARRLWGAEGEVAEVRPADHAEGLAGNASQRRDAHLPDEPGNGGRVAKGPGRKEGLAGPARLMPP